MTVRSASVLAAIIASVFVGALISRAGPLDPPAGPVTSSYKTLTEVEPRIAINGTNTPGDASSLYKITKPGSYYLTGNITGVSDHAGIAIAVSGVKLDLMGFDLVGSFPTLDGIICTAANLKDIEVSNGSIRGWGRNGVDLLSAATVGCTLKLLRISDNHDAGIRAGSQCTISSCTSSTNSTFGIFTIDGCTISDCAASQNPTGGIVTGQGCTVVNCTARANTINGIGTSIGCTVSACSAQLNSGNGIGVGLGTTVAGCSAAKNTGDGINAVAACTINNCTLQHNSGSGIRAGTDCTISGCSLDTNTGNGVITSDSCTISGCTAQFNGSVGVATGFTCIVSNCSARSNSADGVKVGSQSRVSECTASSNSGDGIEVPSQCNVVGNICCSNGSGSGVRATGQGNIIDGNTLVLNHDGVTVSGTLNLVMRNRCASNQTFNFDIGPSNDYGPIINLTSSSGAAISGNSASGSLSSTDPHANFAY